MFSASVKGSGFFQHGPARLCRLKPLQHLSLPHDLIGKKIKNVAMEMVYLQCQ